MSHQMIWDSKESELRCRLAAATFGLSPGYYKTLAEWLDCYVYIVPAARRLLQIEVCIDDCDYAYAIWSWLRNAETCLTLDEQYKSWKLISGY